MKALSLGTLAAIVVQPFVFFLLFLLPALALGAHIPAGDLLGLPLFAAVVAVPFVVAIGIPAFLLLRRLNRLSWQSLGAIGFLAAALPMAIWGSSEYQGYSSGGNWYGTPVNFVINGQKTFYGWLSYAQGIVFYGLHGLAGALAFFFASRSMPGP